MLKDFLIKTLKHNSISFRLTSDDKWIRLDECPYCFGRGHTKNDGYTMCIPTTTPYYYCHRCHATGYLLKLFEHWGLDGVWNKYVLENIDTTNFILSKNMFENSDSSDIQTEKLTYNDFKEFRSKYEKNNMFFTIAKNYLINRGFSWGFIHPKSIIISEKIDVFSKRYFGRILLPDISYTGFTARDYINSWKKEYKLRYLSSGSASVFGGIVNKEDKNIYIVEGPLDAIKLNQFGYNSLAIGGKSKAEGFFLRNKKLLSPFNIIYVIESDVSMFEKDLLRVFHVAEKNYQNVFYLDMQYTGFKDTADINDPKIFEEIVEEKKVKISKNGSMEGLLLRALNKLQTNSSDKL